MQAWDREMHYRLADVWAATEDPARRKELFREYEQVQNSMSAKMTK